MRPLQVGDLVEILDCPNVEMKMFAGHVGKILRASNVYFDRWVVEGAEIHPDGATMHWAPIRLRRIPPKSDPQCDFTPCDEDFQRDLLRKLGRVEA